LNLTSKSTNSTLHFKTMSQTERACRERLRILNIKGKACGYCRGYRVRPIATGPGASFEPELKKRSRLCVHFQYVRTAISAFQLLFPV